MHSNFRNQNTRLTGELRKTNASLSQYGLTSSVLSKAAHEVRGLAGLSVSLQKAGLKQEDLFWVVVETLRWFNVEKTTKIACR